MAKGYSNVGDGYGVTTNPEFRAWVAIFETILQAGLTRTADTGQIADVNTLTAPATNLIFVYSVYRFNDSLQGSAPVFFKIEYGKSTKYTVYVTVGTGSDGAGNITGIIYPRALLTSQNNTLSTANLYVSAKSNYFCFDFAFSTVGGASQFSLERSQNADGTSNGNGIYTINQQYDNGLNSRYKQLYTPFSGTVASAELVPATNPPSGQTNGMSRDGKVINYPIEFYDFGKILPPSRCFVGAFGANVVKGVEMPVKVNGVSQNMIGGNGSTWLSNPTIASFNYYMRYEA
jgi:hypothetical protein